MPSISVEAAISDHCKKDIVAVINGFRINEIGVLKDDLDIFELVDIPSVLNISDMWVEMN